MTYSDVVHRCFERQRELMAKYKILEGLPEPPLSLHTMHGQRIMKDFAWRVTEELSEAYVEVCRQRDATLGEELADTTHFMIELLIFAGITPEQCLENQEEWPATRDGLPSTSVDRFWYVTHSLGQAMHELRNRPWKQTVVPTNEGRFRAILLTAWVELLYLWSSLGFQPQHLDAFFAEKHEINQKRQTEGY